MTWHQDLAAARADGCTFLLDLTAVDEVGRSDDIRVLARLLNPDTGAQRTVDTLVPREDPHLPDVSDLWPGAGFLQRQVHDLFGVVFDGGDNRPLIHHGAGAPLRKDVLLPERLDTAWPGALEPGESGASPSRRKLVPPGVPDPGVLADPESTAADVALSATGVRVRRVR